MSKNYFQYLLKSNKISLIFFFILYLAFAFTPFFMFTGTNTGSNFQSVVMISFVMSILLSFALPVILLKFTMNRTSADVFLALPLSRRSQLITILLFAFGISGGFYAVAVLFTWIFLATSAVKVMNGILLILFGLLIILIMLIVNSFLFLLANNVFDGIIIMSAYTLIPIALFFVINSFMADMVAGYYYTDLFDSGFHIYASVLLMSIKNFLPMIQSSTVNAAESFDFNFLCFILTLVYACIAAYGLKKTFIERKAEQAEQLSDGFFAYPFIISIYAFMILLILAFKGISNSFNGKYIYYLLLFLVYVISSFVYRRKIQITKSCLILFAIFIAGSLCFASISWNTHGFGLADHYESNEGDIISYYYNIYNLETDDGTRVSISFNLDVPLDQKDNMKEAVDILENLRRKSIDSFYSKIFTDYSDGSLEVSNQYVKGSHKYTISSTEHYYHAQGTLSKQELKTISRYTVIDVYSIYDDTEMSFSDYLKTVE